MSLATGMSLEGDLPAGPVVDVVLAAGAAITSSATTAALTVPLGTATAAATVACGSGADTSPSAKEEPNEVSMEVCTEEHATEIKAAVRWDAHLDRPNVQADTKLQPEAQAALRGLHGLGSPAELIFMETFEFISLGCYCAPSYALQLLGLKRHSYPLDWVRSSIDGVLHCLHTNFQDFLTYSTTWTQDQYMVFGGTRWGGSFWHHNLEAPVTHEDMRRRVHRLYGRAEVPAATPRLFVRSINSTREIDSALRLRDALRRLIPDAAGVLLLLIVDLQSTKGPMAIAGEEGQGVLFYQISEADTAKAIAKGAGGLATCAASYAEAVAFAIKYWAGSAEARAATRTFPDVWGLSAACEQWDGGDPARELFTPRKFYGHLLETFPDVPQMKKLCCPTQMFNFVLQADINVKLPLMVECFGKYLQVALPEGAVGGHVLQLYQTDGQLSGTVGLLMQDGQVLPLGPAQVVEKRQDAAGKATPRTVPSGEAPPN